MNASEIRKTFLDFFESKQHKIVDSAPLVVKNDPTLMFINAGMNQFKDYFLGNKEPEVRRIADTQKCLRVSGKHNDLEEVGVDTYHHTLFEMLGNWSFGDYFKKEAIEWAWELLTEVYKLPVDRLYVTIFEGDAGDNLAEDTEAYNLWKAIIPEEKIIKASKADNFWEMGDQGPCGPCSEIHIDMRSEEEIAQISGVDLVNKDHPLVIEIWNLVFIQYNRMADKSLQELPDKHIDTGMGFERLCLAIQGKQSNYDTDVFQPLIQFIAKAGNVEYGKDEKLDIALRVMSDHIRAIAFTIADGQLPSNNGAGYVIRRILRRAVRYAYTFLGFEKPFLTTMVPLLAEQFADIFPELKAQESFIAKVIEKEEESFLKTLTSGINRLDVIIEDVKKNGGDTIDGKSVFQLFDTFGFPVDLTDLIARENDLKIDEDGFNAEMAIQKERARNATASETGDWIIVNDADEVQFIGYDDLDGVANIVKYREIVEKKKKSYQIVLDQTPFYPEGGGQVGDTGYIEVEGQKVSILTTKKENDLIIHFTSELPKVVDSPVKCVVNAKKRTLTANNHTATHLLQAALKQVLGDHVAQKGSLVNEKLLRFDFSHFDRVSEEQILEIEKIVNQKIRENIQLDEKRNCPIDEAQAMGATALFGEKYGEFVRVITFDKDYSMELCGGIHVPATGAIGQFKITSEGSAAAGVRRIEAVTAETAEAYVNKQLALLTNLNEALKSPKDLLKAVEGLVQERSDLSKKVEKFQQEAGKALKADLLNKVEEKDGLSIIVDKIEIDSADVVKNIAFEIKQKVDNLALVLAADIAGKPQITVMLSDNLVKEKELHAGKLVKELAREIKGGGGGQPFYATAGGKDVAGLDAVVSKAKELF